MKKEKTFFRIKKFIHNIENGGVIIGYWTGLQYPKYKIHKLIYIRNRSNKWFAARVRQAFGIKQGTDRSCEYAYPLWLMAVKVSAELLYLNYFRKAEKRINFRRLEDYMLYRAKFMEYELEHGVSFVDKQGRIWLQDFNKKGERVIINRVDRKNQLRIIGDWHSHSNNARPSQADVYSANIRLIKNEKTLLGIVYNKMINIYLYERPVK